MKPEEVTKPYLYNSESVHATEATDAPPVASGIDSTPTNWFELAADLCHSGHITETRMRRAIDIVRKAVERA